MAQTQGSVHLVAEYAEIGRRIANSDHAQSMRIVPTMADSTAHEVTRHRAEPVGVKIAQIDNINGHCAYLPRTRCLLRPFKAEG
jgi:hypothetical protein